MKLTVTTLNDVIVTLEVSPDMEIENFKALCECEVGVPAHDMVILHEGNPLLDNTKDLAGYGIREGDVVLVQQMHRPESGNPLPDLGIDFGAIQVPGNIAISPTLPPTTIPSPMAAAAPRPPTLSTRDKDKETAAQVRQTLMNSPDRLAMLKQNNPTLADAYLSGDNEKFEKVLSEQLADKAERQRQRIAMLNASPFDIEYQKRIAEEIRQENVDSNMEAAMEYHPESFGQVTMLYIHCKVNGHPVRAFIDSGAQTTIMSQACAERCGIMRLVDKRWSGYAKGVGVQKIIGRVHLGHIQINDVFLQSSFSILEDQVMDMLLGLDMLKRHQCCIDLKRNILVIGTTGTETSFLSEGELADLKEFEPNQSLPGPSK